jgi:hypothetical protein
MTLDIQTFSNIHGGSAFFKAVGHPLAMPKANALVARLAKSGSVDIYDPFGQASSFAEFYDLANVEITHVYVQDLSYLDKTVLDRRTEPVTELAATSARTLLVAAFDADRAIAQIKHLIPAGMTVVSFDELRLDNELIARSGPYLHTLNFSTNMAFFRDADGSHTRLTTANYWSGFGAQDVKILFCLFGGDGSILAQWQEALSDTASPIIIDSAEIRKRFELGPFTGQLFIHVIAGAGHDIVKYALDTYGDDASMFSCTHDANAWPADRYAGLPAPASGERVVLWIQNSHPCAIPLGSICLNRMGRDDVKSLDLEIAPFATYALDVATLLPDIAWPEQIEIYAGKHFVRPRYEVESEAGRIRIAHANVERVDLETDPRIPELSNLMGKSYLLPAPVLPIERFSSMALPTPMSTAQTDLPLAIALYDASGKEVLRKALGRLPRDHATLCDVDDLLGDGADRRLTSGYGHMELLYDFQDGGSADGWLHGLFRYADKQNGHVADTSFGAHIFNTVLTYRNEPQSYGGPAPGLSTKLFLRIGSAPFETMCHLIYPTSTTWHHESSTDLVLHGANGEEVARKSVSIPCGGSLLWRYSELFGEAERQEAGDRTYVIVRDTTCRLFGYHGLILSDTGFSLDHMFGF